MSVELLSLIENIIDITNSSRPKKWLYNELELLLIEHLQQKENSARP